MGSWGGVGTPPALSAKLAADISTLWADPALGKAYDRRSEFQVMLKGSVSRSFVVILESLSLKGSELPPVLN